MEIDLLYRRKGMRHRRKCGVTADRYDPNSFTPGPWTWNGDTLTGEDASDEVVRTDSGYYPPWGKDRSLIAAAPDLLAALKELVDECQGRADNPTTGFDSGLYKAAKAGEAAISKAEGK